MTNPNQQTELVIWRCPECGWLAIDQSKDERETTEQWCKHGTYLFATPAPEATMERIPVIEASIHEHTRQSFIKQTENAAEWQRRALKAEREVSAVEGWCKKLSEAQKALIERAKREIPGLRKETAENIKAVREDYLYGAADDPHRKRKDSLALISKRSVTVMVNALRPPPVERPNWDKVDAAVREVGEALGITIPERNKEGNIGGLEEL